jgi:ClpP class serine protease
MKKIFTIIILFVTSMLVASGISYEKNLSSFFHNPAFLGVESDAGVYYKFDYMDQNESRLNLRLSKFAGFSYDLESHTNYWSGGFSLFNNFYSGLTLIDQSGKRSYFDAGFIYRPFSFLSTGLVINDCFNEHSEFEAEASFKFWNDRIILTSGINFVYQDEDDSYETGVWKSGANFELVDGLNLYCEYSDDERIYAGAKFDFSNVSAMYDTEFDKDENQTSRQAIQVTFNKSKPFWQKQKVKQIVLNQDYTNEEKLIDLYLQIDKIIAENPKQIEFIFRDAELNLQAAEELNRLIQKLSRKTKVIAYLDQAELSSYYAVCSANEIYLSEFGNFDMSQKSFVINSTSSDLEVVQVGKKLFVEDIFSADALSNEKHTMLTQLQLDIQDRIYQAMALQKNIPIENMFIISNESPSSAFTAKDAGLITELEVPSENYLVEKKDAFNNKLIAGTPQPWVKPDEVTVIEIDGFIKSGESVRCDNPFYGQKICGLDTILEQLSSAESNPKVKAVILRVNSGGGELNACGTLYQKISDYKKPVVATISGQATGGAYFAISGCDKIFAVNSSLLGGLGVAVLKNDKLLLSRTDNPDELESSLSTEMQYHYLAKQYYKQMITRIASERAATFSTIDDKGEASLYAGTEALNNRFIDEIGSFFDALNYVRKITHLSKKCEIKFDKSKLHQLEEINPKSGFYFYSGLVKGI